MEEDDPFSVDCPPFDPYYLDYLLVLRSMGEEGFTNRVQSDLQALFLEFNATPYMPGVEDVFRTLVGYIKAILDKKSKRSSDGLTACQHFMELLISNHTVLDLISESEHDRDVCDIKLLYCYLVSERRATPVAELLHMHRNNVIYRINNIEKRYNLDLNRFEVRDCLLACFRLKIMHSAKFRKLLA